jgi:hypothetical protein
VTGNKKAVVQDEQRLSYVNYLLSLDGNGFIQSKTKKSRQM